MAVGKKRKSIKDKLNIVLIGYGYWGKNIAKALINISECSFYGVFDNYKNKMDECLSIFPFVKTYDSVEQVAKDILVDAVIIATPVSSHYDIAHLFLSNNKHVLSEKVLSVYLSEIRLLKQLAKSKRLVLEVGFTFLYNSVVERVKKEINKKKLGEIIYLTFKRTGFGPIREDVNSHIDLIPHDISMCLYWLGIPEWVQATGINVIQADKSDVTFIQMGYNNGVVVQMFCSWITPLKQRIIEIIGTHGMIIFDDVNNAEKLKMITPNLNYYKNASDFGSFQLSLKSGDIVVPNIEYPEPLLSEVRSFIKKIQTDRKFKESFNTLEISENVAIILSLIEKSINNNSSKISLGE